LFSYLALVIFLMLIPFWVKHQYYLHVAIIMFLFSIPAIGLRLIWRTGHVSFAQAGFMAIGGYTSAILTKFVGVNFWLAWLIGGILAAMIAIAIGIPTLKLQSSYFFLVTTAMGEVTRLSFLYLWTPVFGGAIGITGVPHPNPIVIPGLLRVEFVTKTSFYYLLLVVLIITVVVMRRIDKSRIGATLQAIRDAEDLAKAVGMPTMRYRVFAFATACFFAGIAGGIYAHYNLQVSPLSFTNLVSMEIFAFVVVGGSSHVLGPVLGTILLKGIGEIVRGAEQYEIIFSGTLMMLVMIFMPAGLLGVPKAISTFIKKRSGTLQSRTEVNGGPIA
jgi:branched-chain amino acid transport system permease protein